MPTKTSLSDLRASDIFFYTLLTIAVVLTFFVIRPFIGVILFAFLIAAYFYPFYKKLTVTFKGRTRLASALTSSLIILVIIIPILAFISIALNQAASAALTVVREIQTGNVSIGSYIDRFNMMLERIPFVSYQLSSQEIINKLVDNFQLIVQTGTDIVIIGSRTAISFFEQVAVFVFLLFGLFPVMKPLKDKILVMSPLPDEVDNLIINRLFDMGKAVVAGIVFVGFVQGIIGGIGFIIVGIPAVAFWMLLMIFLAVIPIVGPGFILVPAITIMLLQGNFWQALVLFLALILAVNIDNYLRPLLVGKRTAIHPILLIIALLGGLKLFGLIGVFFGPMILVFLLTLLEVYEKHYALKQVES